MLISLLDLFLQWIMNLKCWIFILVSWSFLSEFTISSFVMVDIYQLSVLYRWVPRVFQKKWHLFLFGKRNEGLNCTGSSGIVSLKLSPGRKVIWLLNPRLMDHGTCLVSNLLHIKPLCIFLQLSTWNIIRV